MSRVFQVGLVLVTVLAVHALALPRPVSADGAGPNYYRIEEDWALVLLDPDAGRASPQVVTEMSPNGSDTYFCSFDVNHRRQPDLITGGLQVEIWQYDQNVAHKSHGTAVFTLYGESMTWTQYLERNGSSLKFGIVKGTSLPWGDLKTAFLHANCSDTQGTLDQYSSDYSVSRSTITYGANRVSYLTLTQVRKYRYNALGLVVVDVELLPRVVWHQSLLE